MKIKKAPEDFVVIEQFTPNNNGKYSVYKLKKKNLGTPEAARIIEKKYACKVKFCGNKDKFAVTEQFISTNRKIPDVNIQKENYYLKVKFVGTHSQPLSLGSHKGNRFEIRIENTKKEPFNFKEFYFPNYFGEQRFSEKNVEVGEAILERNFGKAISLIDDKYANSHLEEKPSDLLGALKKIPKTILRLYLTSVQSFLFNKELSEHISGKKLSFSKQELNFPKKELKEEGIITMKGWDSGDRRFLFKEYPEISLEGANREKFVVAKKVVYDGKIIKFDLPKSSYATICLRSLFLEDISY